MIERKDEEMTNTMYSPWIWIMKKWWANCQRKSDIKHSKNVTAQIFFCSRSSKNKCISTFMIHEVSEQNFNFWKSPKNSHFTTLLGKRVTLILNFKINVTSKFEMKYIWIFAPNYCTFVFECWFLARKFKHILFENSLCSQLSFQNETFFVIFKNWVWLKINPV